jgi:hypothetical protein
MLVGKKERERKYCLKNGGGLFNIFVAIIEK